MASLRRAGARSNYNDNARMSATISSSKQGRPQGSAAGLDVSPSARVQMDGVGYANPNNQLSRLGIKLSGTKNSPMPTYTGTPSSGISAGNVVDSRVHRSRVDMDRQLSQMI